MAGKNFYKKSNTGKRVLKKTIRPTYKNTTKTYKKSSNPIQDQSEIDHENQSLKDVLLAPPDIDTIRTKQKEEVEPIKKEPVVAKSETIENTKNQDQKPVEKVVETEDQEEEPELEVVEEVVKPEKELMDQTKQSGSHTESEIDEIQRIIQQASARLQDLEKQKKEEEDREAAAAEADVVEEFNGVSDTSEELTLIKEELEKTRSENKRLKHELDLVKEDFEKEKEHLEKSIKSLKKQKNSKNNVEDNKFFSFSEQLSEAIKSIDTLNDQDFHAQDAEVVIPQQNIQQPQQSQPVNSVGQLNVTPPKVLKVDEEPQKKEESKETEKKEVKEEDSQNKDKKKKNSKEKKLLVTGATVLALMLGGGLLTFQFTSKPKIDDSLVDEYLSQNESKVLGVETRKAGVPDGIVADKNSEASYDETKWAEYRDPAFAIQLNYPANVTERLHTSNSITFLRKDSYIFKITKQAYSGTLDEYWESIKDKGFKYEATPSEFKGKDILHLQLLENVEYPGEKYLVNTDNGIYDVWFATDPSIYGEEDIKRVEKMIESLIFL